MAACTCAGGFPASISSITSRETSESSRIPGSTSPSLCVVSPLNSIPALAAASLAQNASIPTKYDRELTSSFWSRERCGRLRTNHAKQENASHLSRSVPTVEARLFGPAIFEASKLRVLFLGKEDEKGQMQHPRIYTLTHSDVTAKITLAVAQEINKAQLMGWYSKLQRDEILAEWRKTKGEMSLHVHCHISGGNWLHNLIAKLRFYIFRKELPVVLEAFMHGDRDLFTEHPELQEAPVWVYFHSNMEEYNKLECWGPLREATKGASDIQKEAIHQALEEIEREQLRPTSVCPIPCECCSRHATVIPIPDSFRRLLKGEDQGQGQQREA